MLNRSSGILLPISSLMGPYGIGCLGKDARRMVDFLRDGGFKAWQVLPLTIPDHHGSPYKSVSAFAGNTLLLDPEQLCERRLITEEELAECRGSQPYTVDYAHLRRQRGVLFHKAFLRRSPEDADAAAGFALRNPWVTDFALYTALRMETGREWYDWEPVLRRREPAALDQAVQRLREPYDEAIFLQYLFFSQWTQLRSYANARKVEIIGDMPIYVSAESVDVWRDQHLFLLDKDGRPAAVAGVPPDLFSATGQLWGNPLYCWEEMERDGFAWWRARLRHAHTLYDRVRLDHFRGFSAYWSVPSQAPDAREGTWRPGPGTRLFDALFQEFEPELLIAEDLGVREPALEELLLQTGLPGMRLLQFAFLEQDGGIHLPYNHTPNTVAYTGTHDNNTLLGYLRELTAAERDYCLRYCGFTGENWQDGGAENPAIRTILRTLWMSPARLVIVPVQDLLGYGADTRINSPGTADGNWVFRLTEGGFSELRPEVYRQLSALYGRL